MEYDKTSSVLFTFRGCLDPVIAGEHRDVYFPRWAVLGLLPVLGWLVIGGRWSRVGQATGSALLE